MAKHEEIKTMKLYHHLDRIERRLQMAADKADKTTTTSTTTATTPLVNGSTRDKIDPELLGTMDCLHFFGDEPIQKVQQLIAKASAAAPRAEEEGAAHNVRVLDIGTGYGGSARLLAHRTGCHVDALELQPDLSAVAQELTKRCALQDKVTHLTGDFLLREVTPKQYDVVVALLCFLHIGQWKELFTRCLTSLKPGGVLYVEDFFQRGDAFSDHDLAILRDDIYCAQLIPKQEMLMLLEEIGFEIVAFDDVTAKWTPYVATRAVTFEADLDKHMELDGEDAAKALNHFYTSVAKVFSTGNLGGYTLTARRPASCSEP